MLTLGASESHRLHTVAPTIEGVMSIFWQTARKKEKTLAILRKNMQRLQEVQAFCVTMVAKNSEDHKSKFTKQSFNNWGGDSGKTKRRFW